MLIDGQWVGSDTGETFTCVDPFTGQGWGLVPRASKADVDRAVQSARRAFFEGGWGRTLPNYRAGLLRTLAQLLQENSDELALNQVMENGKLLSEMRYTGPTMANACHVFAALGETLHGYAIQSSVPNYTSYTRREPIGVVAAITPWNTPINLLGMKLLPALASGNTIVIKPSEITPTSTLLLGELIQQAGFPPGVVNIITGYGKDTGAALVAHPHVDKIAFTGSTATGTAIAKVAAERHARVSLELGGKSPNIIFDDANIAAAIPGIASGIFAAAGQACNAGSRVLLQAGIYDEVAQRLSDFAKAMRVGDPLDLQTELGPLASHAQFEKVTGYLDIGRNEGFALRAGGHAIDRPGYFVEATVFDDVSNDSRIAREEIFGPVASLIRFDDEEEALSIANDTKYGLASGIWTTNLGRAHRIINRVRAGVVWVNTYRMGSPLMPFGGYKQSGIGREGGLDSLNLYTEEKAVWINTDPAI
jgi:acyl-CoA reductase-like NAD-dependent aldehyde dehydrogenase